MRPLLLLLLLPALAVQAAPFPAALAPERPVSDAALSLAAGDQRRPAVASNGQLSLAAWVDRRAGFPERIYATRVDAAGNALDPAGIPLTTRGTSAALGGVVWNGTHFAVALTEEFRWKLVFVAPDGTIAGTRALDFFFEMKWLDATDGGPAVRMLFARSSSGEHPMVSIVDGDGDVIARDVELVGGMDRGEILTAGSRGAEFLVLMRARRVPDPQWRTVAVRIDSGGQILSSIDSQLALDVTGAALEGGASGWILVAEDGASRLLVQRLDARGVAVGAASVLFEGGPDVQSRTRPSIVRDNGRFTVVWFRREQNQPAYTWGAFVSDDGAATGPQRLQEWGGTTGSLAVAGTAGQRLLLTSLSRPGAATGTDLFAQTVSDALTAAAPVAIAQSAPAQAAVSTAAGQNGYLTSWVERGPDAFAHVLVRRVLPDGSPQGPPVEAAAIEPGSFTFETAVVSNGSRYLLVWNDGASYFGRRMAAESGVWFDDAPFLIAEAEDLDVASNGTDALAAWNTRCGAADCLQSRRIALSGDPVAEPIVTLLRPADPQKLALASSGSDYLAVWTEGPPCEEQGCFEDFARELHALRLRADGTKIDAAPIVLVGLDAQTEPTEPAVAWNAGRYLVAWHASPSDAAIQGALVTAEGAILERRPLVPGGGSPHLLAHRDQFILFAYDSNWTAVSFDASASLAGVAALPRTTIVEDPLGTLDAASSGSTLLVTYDRLAGPEAGGVARAYTRLFGSMGGRRRRAVR